MAVQAKFRMFESKLKPEAFSCFRVLFENVRELLLSGKGNGGYEIPVSRFLELSGAADVEAVAEAIREIIQCRVELVRGDLMYFYTFFNSVSIEGGNIRYTVPREVEEMIPSASIGAAS